MTEGLIQKKTTSGKSQYFYFGFISDITLIQDKLPCHKERSRGQDSTGATRPAQVSWKELPTGFRQFLLPREQVSDTEPDTAQTGFSRGKQL